MLCSSHCKKCLSFSQHYRVWGEWVNNCFVQRTFYWNDDVWWCFYADRYHLTFKICHVIIIGYIYDWQIYYRPNHQALFMFRQATVIVNIREINTCVLLTISCSVSGVISPKAVLHTRKCCPQLGKAKHKGDLQTKKNSWVDWRKRLELVEFKYQIYGKIHSNWTGRKILYRHLQSDSVQCSVTCSLHLTRPRGPVGTNSSSTPAPQSGALTGEWT